MTDAELAVLESLLPLASHVERPRKWPLRCILKATLYLLRGGLPLRMPPLLPAPIDGAALVLPLA